VDKSAETSAAPKARGGAGLGRTLFLAFGAVAATTVAASAIAWVNFTTAGQTIEEITAKRMPTAIAALQLARVSAETAAIAPGLATADDDAERHSALSSLQEKEGAVQTLIGELEQAGHAAAVERLQPLAAEMSAKLNTLNTVVQDRIVLARQKTNYTNVLRLAHEKFLQVVTPLIDETSFGLVMSLQSVSEKAGPQDIARRLSQLASNELAQFDAMLRLTAEANQLVGVLIEAAVVPSEDMLAPLRERFVAIKGRLLKALDAADNVAKNDDRASAARALLAFGEGRSDLFGLRQRELAAIAAADEAMAANHGIAARFGQEVAEIVGSAQAMNQAAVAASNQTIAWGKMLLLAFAAISLGAATFVAWFYVGRRVVGRLSALKQAMRDIAAGRLDASIPSDGRDEIAEMAAALAVFRDTAREARAADARAEEERVQASKMRQQDRLRLAESLEQTVKGVVGVISSSASTMHSTAESMSATAEQTAKQSTAAAAASDHASANVQTVASAAEELATSIVEIGRRVEQSAAMAKRAVEEANGTNASVEGLSVAAQRIGEVVKLINAIAGQTNLLALNATIEAARAGEAGKGFAVVASEVKGLASQTAKATEEVATQIAEIQAATRASVEAIRRIGKTIHDIADTASGIAAAVEEQRAATEEIARNVQQAAKGTGEVSSNIEGVSRAARETGQAAGQVLSVAAELARQSEQLQAEVDRFVSQIRAV
jgi:methyl-accepting chemotaxis protein